MADAIATAYVKLIPTFDGQLGKTISREMGAADTKSEGNKAGKQYTKGAESGMSNLSDAVKGKFSAATVAIGNLMSSAITSAVSSAASGISSLMSTAFNGFADYQQLEGGIKKLFDDESGEAYSIVMKNAKQAYKTAGMSANEYMEQVSGFSAALVNSLGGDTVTAAERADVAMRAISDNVNTFGTDAQSVSTAFQGFAKQNYTMLDNLKLGYGGTKSEMERLIADANEWGAANGAASDLSIDSFADVVTAIDQIQQKQKIAGTTEAEAMKTVSGSIGMLEGAWTNLISSFGDKDADFGQLSKDLTESLGAVFDNVAPLLGTIATNVMDNVPMIFDGIGKTIEETLLPKMKEAFSNVLGNLGIKFDEAEMSGALEGLSKKFEKLGEDFESFANAIGPTVAEFFSWLAPKLVVVADAVLTVIDAFAILGEGLHYVAGEFGNAFAGLPDAIGGFFDEAGKAAEGAFNALVEFVTGIPEKIIGFFSGIGVRITEAIGSIHFPTPHVTWEPLEIFGMSTPVNLPHITWSAMGGIFNRPTVLTGVGEDGSEAVIPLSNRQYVRPFAQAVAAEMGGGGGGSVVYNINVTAGSNGDEIASTITKAIRAQELMRRR